MRRTLPLALVALLALAGCLPDGLTDFDFNTIRPPRATPEAPRGWVEVGQADAGTVHVILYAEGGAHAGYARLRVGLVDAGGAPIREAHVTLAADVARGGGTVPLPVEAPATTTADEEGYFAAALYLLPDAPGAAAYVEIGVETAGHTPATATLPLAITDDPLWDRVTSSDGLILHAAWVRPERPVVGDNTFEARLFRETAEGFAPLAGAQVQLYPFMDMGGGEGHSTPFTPPFEPEPGLIRCQVNFIMSGGWELSLFVRREGQPRDTVRFAPFTVHEQ